VIVLTRLLIAILLCALGTSVLAFQVLPKVSDVDRKLSSFGSNGLIDSVGQWLVGAGVPLVKAPVHEAITLSALGCTQAAGEEVNCLTEAAVKANRILLYGVRWPDDPPFRLNPDKPPRIPNCDVNVTVRSTAQPKCWYGLFKDAGVRASKARSERADSPAFGPGDYLLYRSHYGDLQFIHSMGANDGELAGETIRRMKMWTRFLWGVGLRELPTDKFIRELGVDGLGSYFPGDITVTNVFATGIVEVRKDLDKVAIGALLHMVQDSFSKAHTERTDETGATCTGLSHAKPGQIARFYSYPKQDSTLHDEQDTFDALGLHTLQISPNVVEVSRAFLDLWHQRANWQQAETLFDCVFDIKDPTAPAVPGRFAGPKVSEQEGFSGPN
jgi:hypothetical protein